MRRLALFGVASLTLALLPTAANAAPYILYLHGRSHQGWSYAYARVPGWTDVSLAYDGNARLASPVVGGQIKGAFSRYCSGQNHCAVVCHSAGCMRALRAVDQLTAEGAKLAILWIEAAASAAGGTLLAEHSTNLLGDEPIDEDIRRDAARASTGWGYIQDAMPPATMYHLAGKKSACAYMLCGNWFLPAGTCDGLVCIDSAGGISKAGSFSDACTAGLYPGRRYDRDSGSCTGVDKNHNDMATYAVDVVRGSF